MKKINSDEVIHTKESLLDLLKSLDNNTRVNFRKQTGLNDSVWEQHFGNWKSFVRAADLDDNIFTARYKSAISRHEQYSDKLKSLQSTKESWGGKYLKDSSGRFKTILCGSDMHDKLCDPFYRRLFVDTAKRAKPDKIVLNGDTFEMYEFSKYNKDPRNVDIIGAIKWVHNLLKDLREVSPNSEIIIIEGNHEARLIKFMYEVNVNLVPILSEIHGMEFSDLLGLDAYEVNYIGKASLAYHRETDLKQEIKKNYYLAYDSVLFHHFPYASAWGYAGVNGHHHKHSVIQNFDAQKGPYEWHQLGCGHIRQASYCEGEIWTNGFVLCHVDTDKKYTQFEYIDCTGEACMIGGQWYTREPNEIIRL